MINETIRLEEYNPEWPKRYLREANQLVEACKPMPIAVEHIGSTAIEGLLAKPIIDIMLGLPTWEFFEGVKNGLITAGYEDLGEAGVPGRVYFRKRSGTSFNAHVVLLNDRIWSTNIRFKDYFLNHPQEKTTYGNLKKSIVDRGAVDLITYSKMKADYMASILSKA
ncbi:GrpB family protein [Spirosoma koreense]